MRRNKSNASSEGVALARKWIWLFLYRMSEYTAYTLNKNSCYGISVYQYKCTVKTFGLLQPTYGCLSCNHLLM